MEGRLIGTIVILGLILVILGIIFYAYRKIRKSIRYYSRMLFGASSLAEGIKGLEKESLARPKSVSAATSLYLPSIMRDFPEFHYDEMKTRAENVLISYLRSIDGQNPELLTEGTEELRAQLKMKIEMLGRMQCREHFEKIQIHRTEIHQYRKSEGRCSIIMQASVEYLHYTEQEGRIVEGRKDLPKQARYNVELVYIQDREQIKKRGESGMGLVCPNCGAPIPGVGAKKCVYCDTQVIAFNIRVWNFSKVEERK